MATAVSVADYCDNNVKSVSDVKGDQIAQIFFALSISFVHSVEIQRVQLLAAQTR